MAVVPVNLTSLLTTLNTSGVQVQNPALYQVIKQLIQYLRQTTIALGEEISSGSGSSGSGITQLTGDVTAGPGSGSVVATIAADAVTTVKILDNNVTYAKIQQVTGLRLVGNPDSALADMVEIPIGDGLAFLDGELIVEIAPGVPGLLHRLLSATHYDTVPDAPIFGDIIRAVEGPDFEGEYYFGVANTTVVEDFTGIRMGYSFAFHGTVNTGNYMGYCPPELDFIAYVPQENWLAWEYIDGFAQSLLVEDFTGIRAGYGKFFDYLSGVNNGYLPPELSFIVPPSPENIFSEALWERMAVGAEDEVLTIVDGAPEWAALPEPPDEPEYPWEDITFDAGDFTATGGATPDWTVVLANVERYQQQRFPQNLSIGHYNVRIAIYLRDTTVVGSAPTQLQIQLPFTLSGRYAEFISIQENSAASNDVFVEYDSAIDGSILTINKIAGAVFDTTASGTFLAFEISGILQP